MLHHLWSSLFPPDKPIDFITLLLLSNIALSAAHAFLEWLHPKTKNTWDDKLYVMVSWLLGLLEWMMAARVGRKLEPRKKG